ncbi:MAG: PqiC family protein [Gammaproteobacteria bacterium]|nr:PqiC family protein [Gammaproteobacteria bacterium]
MKLFYLIFMLLLTGCGSVSTPDSHYYRLTDIKEDDVIVKAGLDAGIAVAQVKVSGLLQNRNLLYVEQGKPNEIIPFHYHLWHESLPKLLTRHFIDYLKLAGDSDNIIHYKYTADHNYRLQLSVSKMEIHYLPDASSLLLKVSIQMVDKKGVMLLNKDYSSVKSYKTRDIYQLVTHYNEVLIDVYSQFIKDVNLL